MAGHPAGLRVLPEIAHVYPVYRVHIISGRIAPADTGTVHDACAIIRRLVSPGPNLVVAPLAVGRHVDHVIVRTAAECGGAPMLFSFRGRTYGDLALYQIPPAG